MPKPTDHQALDRRRVFRLLVLYRWLSLAPAVIAVAAGAGGSFGGGQATGLAGTLVLAAAANLIITLWPAQLNQVVRARPWLLAVDLVFCAGLAAVTGGWETPFYLYALSPLLAAAFFFQWRGALIAAALLVALFTAVGAAAPSRAPLLEVGVRAVGFFLIAGVFGYASLLLAELQTSHLELDRAHRDLSVIHHLTVSLQKAADVDQVQERILQAVTNDLGFPRAVIALVHEVEPGHPAVVTAWLGRARDGLPASPAESLAGLPHAARVLLVRGAGRIAEALLSGQADTRPGGPEPLADHSQVNACLQHGSYWVLPMQLRDHPVGVLLVDTGGLPVSEGQNASLQAIASQSAVALGTTLMCIDRAQRVAVQDERLRFARDVHDTVSQSLFGLAYALDACVRLLPAQPERARAELVGLVRLAEETRATLRQTILNIWPAELTPEQFGQDLREYVQSVCRADGLELAVEVDGGFAQLPTLARRSLYRVAQEALTNVVHHAGAHRAQVRLAVAAGQASLTVQDDGHGFDPAQALTQAVELERFGLRGIRERAAALGGRCELDSLPGAGTTLRVTIPVDA